MTTSQRGVDPDAVMVALIVAPGVYSRNRMFSLFENAAMKAARKRANLVRGIVRQWMLHSRSDLGITFAHEGVRLTYAIESVHLRCEVLLTDLEAACLRYVCSRGPKAVLASQTTDAERVLEMLARLA
jgi:hypothetical protein